MTTQAKREKILEWHRKQYPSTQISRQLNIPIEEVNAIIQTSRHTKPAKPSKRHGPEFIEPPLFH